MKQNLPTIMITTTIKSSGRLPSREVRVALPESVFLHESQRRENENGRMEGVVEEEMNRVVRHGFVSGS